MEIENIGSISSTPPLNVTASDRTAEEPEKIEQAYDEDIGQKIDILA